MRRIQMKNKGNAAVEYVWNLKKDSAIHSPFFINNDLQVKFLVLPQKPRNSINMSFGLGSWTDSTVGSIADDLESLEIRRPHDTIILTSTPTIKSYLFGRRRGITKSRIVLEYADKKGVAKNSF